MQLTTEYREASVGTLKGNKEVYLVCTVAFSAEERAIVQQRGTYDTWVEVPASDKPRSLPRSMGVGCLTLACPVIALIGLLFVVDSFIDPALMRGAGIVPYLMLFGGIAGFIYAKKSDWDAKKYDENPAQHITIRKLMSNPTFQVHAFSMVEAREYEEQVRTAIATLAQHIRSSAAAGEKNTYEL